jgi:hypothetical protein
LQIFHRLATWTTDLFTFERAHEALGLRGQREMVQSGL